jgi:hypothetical protein
MKLDAKTVGVLKNYSTINPSLLFREGNVLSTISPSKTIIAKATVPNTFNRRCAIYELTKLLGGISLSDDPEVSFNETSVTIKDEKTQAASSITYASEATIKVPPEKNLVLPSVDVSVDITDNDLKSIIRAAGIYGLPAVALVGDGSKVSFVAMNPKDPNSNTYSIPIGNTEKTFKVVFNVDNLLKLMSGNYHLDVSSKLLAHFVGADIEYWVAVETSSTF